MSQTPDSAMLGLQNYQHPDKFGEWLGYKVVNIDVQTHVIEVALEIREDHLSPAGKVHGGVISAFFDFACGAAVFTTLNPNDFCATVELKVNYFQLLQLGDQLMARVEVVFRGKRLCVVHGRMYRKGNEEQAVAMVTGTFNIVVPKV